MEPRNQIEYQKEKPNEATSNTSSDGQNEKLFTKQQSEDSIKEVWEEPSK